MKVVLDSNILLVSVSEKSPYHWLWKCLIEEGFTLCLSNEILLEYIEVLNEHMSEKYSGLVVEMFSKLPNVEYFDAQFRWQLIKRDVDDNKFVDCAIVANADFIVTEDKHFNVLRKIPFPKVEIKNIKEFKRILKIK